MWDVRPSGATDTAPAVSELRQLIAAFEGAEDDAGVLRVAVEAAGALGIHDIAAWVARGPELLRVAASGRLEALAEPPRPGVTVPELPGLDVHCCGAPGRRDGLVVALLEGEAAEGAERLGLVLDLASGALRRIDRAREALTAAARVAAERQRTRALVDQSPLIVALRVGPDHVLEMANGRYVQMVGADRALFGRPGRETLPEVAAQGFFDVLDRVYATGEPYSGHEVYARFDRHGDGHLEEGWFNYTWAPLREADGRIVGTAMHAVDVTEQVQARREAEAARGRFRDLVNSIDAIVWEAELDAPAWTFVSEWAERVLGYPLRRWYEPGFWRSIVHPDDADRVTTLSRTASQRGMDHEVEYRVVASDGRTLWMHDAVRVLRDAEGRPRRVRGVMLDVTARKEAERERDHVNAQLPHTQKLGSLGFLAGGVAQHVDDLLAGLLGSASLALANAERAGVPTEPLQDVVVAARRAQALTHELLAYAGRAPVRDFRSGSEPSDLSTVVGTVLGLVQATLPRRVELAVSLSSRLPPVQADPARLQQVVLNLVLNAAEALGDVPGRVCVATSVEEVDPGRAAALQVAAGDHVVLEVMDTGVGMGPEVLARVFDPFYSTKGVGRGLGLPAVAGIVRALGGAIVFDSAPGAGTRCLVYLPAGEGEAGRPGSCTEAPRMRRAEGTILVVDDEPEVRSTARLLLEYLGYRVVEADEGPAALRILAEDTLPITGVLLDLTMPGMDGEQTLARIRMAHPTLPVVVSSGYDHDGKMAGFTDAATTFLQKPYTVHELADRLVTARAGIVSG